MINAHFYTVECPSLMTHVHCYTMQCPYSMIHVHFYTIECPYSSDVGILSSVTCVVIQYQVIMWKLSLWRIIGGPRRRPGYREASRSTIVWRRIELERVNKLHHRIVAHLNRLSKLHHRDRGGYHFFGLPSFGQCSMFTSTPWNAFIWRFMLTFTSRNALIRWSMFTLHNEMLDWMINA